MLPILEYSDILQIKNRNPSPEIFKYKVTITFEITMT